MSREGSNPEIAVDIMSIELAAVVEGAVQEDVPGRMTVADSEALGQEEQQASVAVSKTNISQDDVVSREGEINAIPETKEFSSEDQSSEIPAATDAGRKEDELDADHKTKVAQVENALDSLAKPVPSWDPPASELNLRKEGEEWMKKTAESCALVAALITTVVFSAAFQLPGGLNNDTGSPVLVKKASFVIFAMSNAVSLLASTSSILMFLSILTSRYAERDFLKSLPQKLIMGLILLLVSMATMVVGFTVTFFITFREGLRWPPIIIAILASVPITLFALQQFPLLAEMYYSTYKSQKTFSPRQNKLFNVCSLEENLAHGWHDPATHLHEVKHRHVEQKLYNYLPNTQQLTDSDVFTMTHTV